MYSKFKIFSKLRYGLYKLKGDIKLPDILNIIEESYSQTEFKSLTYTIFDFRECSFKFDDKGVKKIAQLVEKNKLLTKNIKTALLVNDPKITAFSILFQTYLDIPEKKVEVNCTIARTINVFNLSITEDELENMFREL